MSLRSRALRAFCIAAALGFTAIQLVVPSAAAPGAASPPRVAADAAPFLIDAQRSELRFTISRPGETIDGHAHRFSGEVRFDPAQVTLDVEAGSLETGNRIRDRKMRGVHLETERFPEILFHSTSIQIQEMGEAVPGAPAVGGKPPDGRPARKALIEGIVTLHGVPRSILFPALIRYDNGSLAAEGDFAVRLTDHAIAIPRFLWIVLDDEVKIHFRFEAAPRTGAPQAGAPPETGAPRR